MAGEKADDFGVKHGDLVSLLVLVDVNKGLAGHLDVDVAIESHLYPRETFALELIQPKRASQESQDEPT